ncbi:MAG TPA: hypothetical protein VK638_07490 [Edaphobacter sp.]|nr:hypothetical protein [Edaphobacter sp.]
MNTHVQIKLNGLISDIRVAKSDFHKDLNTSYGPSEEIAESVTAVLEKAIPNLETIYRNN